MFKTSVKEWKISYPSDNSYYMLNGQIINLTYQQFNEINNMNGRILYRQSNQSIYYIKITTQKVKDHITQLLERKKHQEQASLQRESNIKQPLFLDQKQMQTTIYESSKPNTNFSINKQWMIIEEYQNNYKLKDEKGNTILQLTNQMFCQIKIKYKQINLRQMSFQNRQSKKVWILKDNLKQYIESVIQQQKKNNDKKIVNNQQLNTSYIKIKEQEKKMDKVQSALSKSANKDFQLWRIQNFYNEYTLINGKGISYKLTNNQFQQIEQKCRKQYQKQLQFYPDQYGNRNLTIAKIYDSAIQAIIALILDRRVSPKRQRSMQQIATTPQLNFKPENNSLLKQLLNSVQILKQSQMKVVNEQFCKISESSKASQSIFTKIDKKSISNASQLQKIKKQYKQSKDQSLTQVKKLIQQLKKTQKLKVQNLEKEKQLNFNITKQSQKYRQQAQIIKNKCSNLEKSLKENETEMNRLKQNLKQTNDKNIKLGQNANTLSIKNKETETLLNELLQQNQILNKSKIGNQCEKIKQLQIKLQNAQTTIQKIKKTLGLESSNNLLSIVYELRRQSNILKNFCQFETDCQRQIIQNIHNYDPKQSQIIEQHSVYQTFIKIVERYQIYNRNTHQYQSQMTNMQKNTKLQIKQTKEKMEKMEIRQAQLKKQINEEHSKYEKLYNQSQLRLKVLQSQKQTINEHQRKHQQLNKLKHQLTLKKELIEENKSKLTQQFHKIQNQYKIKVIQFEEKNKINSTLKDKCITDVSEILSQVNKKKVVINNLQELTESIKEYVKQKHSSPQILTISSQILTVSSILKGYQEQRQYLQSILSQFKQKEIKDSALLFQSDPNNQKLINYLPSVINPYNDFVILMISRKGHIFGAFAQGICTEKNNDYSAFLFSLTNKCAFYQTDSTEKVSAVRIENANYLIFGNDQLRIRNMNLNSLTFKNRVIGNKYFSIESKSNFTGEQTEYVIIAKMEVHQIMFQV